MKRSFLILICASLVAVQACSDGPTVVQATDNNTNSKATTGVFDDEHAGHDHSDHSDHDHAAHAQEQDAVHTVKVNEVLPTQRYVYLKVEEDAEEFWIATSKMEITIDDTYFYRGGLLKTNFESKEHNRVFDKIFLVSQLVPAGHAAQTADVQVAANTELAPAPVSGEVVKVEGSVAIADLVANPEKYADKKIQISGVCTKVNANIMGKNWLHLQDGSKNDFDLVITSSTAVPVGHTVTMSGIVSLNKDFGAGYQYDIIVEEGQLVQ